MNCQECNATLCEPQVEYRNMPACTCCKRDRMGIIVVVGTVNFPLCNDCHEQMRRIERIDYINGVGTVKVPYDTEGK